MINILVGGLEHGFYFSHHIGNVIIPTDELIFFRGVGLNHQPELAKALKQSKLKHLFKGVFRIWGRDSIGVSNVGCTLPLGRIQEGLKLTGCITLSRIIQWFQLLTCMIPI